ncbi:hypothetical protein [Arthrobacter sp. B1805]|uniref:MmyB family transcriptional regulator n=1 Tax=Arthrobacter sp. B1805 TaxID=2058892 RepID=UPI000CE45BC7|nr:hypothetical protein [Arthrobacter sp. B1805]
MTGNPEFMRVISDMIERLPNTPAIVINAAGDVLAGNDLAHELFIEFTVRGNLNRMVFLDPAAHYCDAAWTSQARDCLRSLREAYQYSHDPAVDEVVSDLLRSSASFRVMWTAQEWNQHDRSARIFHHPEMGPLIVDEVRLVSAANPELILIAFVPRPGSPSDDSLRLLATLQVSP